MKEKDKIQPIKKLDDLEKFIGEWKKNIDAKYNLLLKASMEINVRVEQDVVSAINYLLFDFIYGYENVRGTSINRGEDISVKFYRGDRSILHIADAKKDISNITEKELDRFTSYVRDSDAEIGILYDGKKMNIYSRKADDFVMKNLYYSYESIIKSIRKALLNGFDDFIEHNPHLRVLPERIADKFICFDGEDIHISANNRESYCKLVLKLNSFGITEMKENGRYLFSEDVGKIGDYAKSYKIYKTNIYVPYYVKKSDLIVLMNSIESLATIQVKHHGILEI